MVLQAEARVVSVFTFWSLFSQNDSGSFLWPLSVVSSYSKPKLAIRIFFLWNLFIGKVLQCIDIILYFTIYIYQSLFFFESIKLDKYKIW